MRRLLSAGVGRLVRRANLHTVVVASCDLGVCAWLQPDWLLTLDDAGGRLEPNAVVARGERPLRPECRLAYCTDEFDQAPLEEQGGTAISTSTSEAALSADAPPLAATRGLRTCGAPPTRSMLWGKERCAKKVTAAPAASP